MMEIFYWARSGSKKENLEMNDGDWYIIKAFLHDLYLVIQGLTSLEFNNNLNIKLNEKCDGIESINKLKILAVKK